MRPELRTSFVALIVFAVLAGCAGSGRLEQLDEQSGATIVRGPAVLVYARTEPRYSRSGRDYVYLGPVETNRQGVREYYLWVGVASTLDRGYIAPEGAMPARLFIDVGGAPMELVLARWHEREPALGDARVYGTAVKVQEELAARVTLDQLQHLAEESLRSLRVVDSTGGERAYFRWDEESTWPGFLAETAGEGR